MFHRAATHRPQQITCDSVCAGRYVGRQGRGRRGPYGVLNMLEVGGADIHDEAICNILVLQGTAPNHQKLGVCFLHNVRQVRLVGAADFAVRARSRWKRDT